MVWLIANAASAGLVLAALPHAVGDFWAYTLALYFLYAIACLGLGLSWGQAGLLSLGQGFFVGMSAYLSGLTLIAFSHGWLVYPLLAGCAVLPGMLAYLIGRMIFHGRSQNGAFFALITLGLVLLAYQVANSWNSVTGGFNGLRGIPGIPGMDGFRYAYTLSAVALWLAIVFVAWIIATPLGVLWRALSQDERRVAFLGFECNRLKAVAFGFSGLLGGVAGTLYAPENNLVTPDLFGFALSTNFVVWVAIGGRSTLYGPVFGAVGIGLATAHLRETVDFWEVILAVVFIFVVLYSRGGVFGRFEPAMRRLLSGARARRMPAPARALDAGGGSLGVDRLNLRAGGVNIINDLSFEIERPGVYCLIGPNGAGKTTTFNAMTGEMTPQSGTVRIMGAVRTVRLPHILSKAGLGRKFQIPNVFDDLTVGENLAIALWTGRISRRGLLSFAPLSWTSRTLEELQGRFEFLRQHDRNAKELSHGQRQILDLAMALCTEPKAILLDEPCAGLSLAETREVVNTIRWAVNEFNATAVVIEHDMTLVRELADRVFVLHEGQLLAEGSVEDIQNNAVVKSVYAGGAK